MKISFVMPVFNSEKTVMQAVNSFRSIAEIYNQATLFIVDDC